MSYCFTSLHKISRTGDNLIERTITGLSILLLLCTIISAGNAFVRKITGYSANSYLELQWMFYSAVFLLGAAHVLKNDGHIRIDILYTYFSNKTKTILNLFFHLFLTLPILYVILTQALPFWYSSFMPSVQHIGHQEMHSWFHYLFIDTSYHEISPNAGGLPTPFAKMLLPLGLILLIIQTANEILKSALILFKNKCKKVLS